VLFPSQQDTEFHNNTIQVTILCLVLGSRWNDNYKIYPRTSL